MENVDAAMIATKRRRLNFDVIYFWANREEVGDSQDAKALLEQQQTDLSDAEQSDPGSNAPPQARHMPNMIHEINSMTYDV